MPPHDRSPLDRPVLMLSVIVASHGRPLRLRWLLNALAEQTLDRARWEVLVGHDGGEETDRVLTEHPLAVAGLLRSVRAARSPASPGANRNAALRLARAPSVVFTDDDCRPPRQWLECVAAAVKRHPGAIVQGPVAPDPDEGIMLRSSFPRSQRFSDVPRTWAECANIAYPRAAVAAVGGFREDVRTGEDVDVNLRVRQRGVAYVGDTEMLTFHAIEEGTALDWVRDAERWGDLVSLVARHPSLRRELVLGVFWKRTHLWLASAVALTLLGRRRTAPPLLLLWALERPVRGGGPRGAIRHVLALPGYAAIDLAELAVLVRASLRERSVLL